jgi:hypothetical protein
VVFFSAAAASFSLLSCASLFQGYKSNVTGLQQLQLQELVSPIYRSTFSVQVHRYLLLPVFNYCHKCCSSFPIQNPFAQPVHASKFSEATKRFNYSLFLNVLRFDGFGVTFSARVPLYQLLHITSGRASATSVAYSFIRKSGLNCVVSTVLRDKCSLNDTLLNSQFVHGENACIQSPVLSWVLIVHVAFLNSKPASSLTAMRQYSVGLSQLFVFFLSFKSPTDRWYFLTVPFMIQL